jgi:hypothetical protein
MITTTDQSEDKKANLKKLREFHTATINELGASNFFLLGKMSYLDKGKKVISFFQSEISKGQDVFVEFTNRYNVPEFPDRTLYRWRFNPHFEEEYEKTAEEDPTKVRYLIPIDELKVVKSYSPAAVIKPAETEFEFSLPNPEKDPLISELTIRDLAAILLQKPVSNKEWLNNIIKNK